MAGNPNHAHPRPADRPVAHRRVHPRRLLTRADTSNDALEHWAQAAPDRVAIVDGRVRLGFPEYYRRAERPAAYLAKLGLGSDDVVAIQLPNWSEFAVARNAAMLAGNPVLFAQSVAAHPDRQGAKGPAA